MTIEEMEKLQKENPEKFVKFSKRIEGWHTFFSYAKIFYGVIGTIFVFRLLFLTRDMIPLGYHAIGVASLFFILITYFDDFLVQGGYIGGRVDGFKEGLEAAKNVVERMFIEGKKEKNNGK